MRTCLLFFELKNNRIEIPKLWQLCFQKQGISAFQGRYSEVEIPGCQ